MRRKNVIVCESITKLLSSIDSRYLYPKRKEREAREARGESEEREESNNRENILHI